MGRDGQSQRVWQHQGFEHVGYLEVDSSAPVHFQVMLLQAGLQGIKPSVAVFLTRLFTENLEFTRHYFLKVI